MSIGTPEMARDRVEGKVRPSREPHAALGESPRQPNTLKLAVAQEAEIF